MGKEGPTGSASEGHGGVGEDMGRTESAGAGGGWGGGL